MAITGNLVHESSTSTGTGNLTLAAVNGKQRFSSAFGTGGTNVFWYFISNRAATEWEVGTGHMSDADTLVRDTVLYSSNSNAAVSFSAGTKDIASDVPATLQVKRSEVRELLTANRTYYVRADGSDSNTGLADTSGGAFLKIQAAVDATTKLDLNGYSVTVQVRDGTFTDPVVLKDVVGYWGPGCLTIQGNNTTPANVLVSTTSASAFTASNISTCWDIKDLKVQTTTSGSGLSLTRSPLRYGNLNFGACASTHVNFGFGAYVEVISNYTISGGAPWHWIGQGESVLSCSSKTITLSGTPSFSAEFTRNNGSYFNIPGNTFSGSATGTRYLAQLCGSIITNGGGASYLPGSVAGSTATGGQYI